MKALAGGIMIKILNLGGRTIAALKVNYLVAILIIFFALLHMPWITTPPIDEHNWRQTDTAAVARNFQFESSNIFLPRVDGRGQFSGITGMEFPAYNYILYIANSIFGYQHWHGRVITLIFGCLGLAFFYALIKRRYYIWLACISTFVMALTPLYFSFSKNIQPDILMLFLSVAGLYFTQRFSEKYQDRFFYTALACFSLAILIKVPGVFILLPAIYILKKEGLQKILDIKKMLSILLFLVAPALGWYLWSDHLSKAYGMGNYFYGDISFAKSLALVATKGFWYRICDYILPIRFVFGPIYLLAFIGLFVSVVRKKYLPIIWLLSFALFIGLFSIKSYYHNYYSLSLVPPIALMVGIALEWIYSNLKKDSKIIAKIFIVVIVAGGTIVAFINAERVYKNRIDRNYSKLESVVDAVVPKNKLVITNANSNPVALYFSNRKGWSLPNALLGENEIKTYIIAGAKYLIIDKSFSTTSQISELGTRYKNIYEDNTFVIFEL